MIFELPDFNDKDVIFIGRGKEWQSFEKFYNTHIHGRSLKNIYIDTENKEAVDQELTSLDMQQTIVVKTAGYPGRFMPVPYTTPTRVFMDCLKQLGAKSIGITGTKGKTTTSSLIAAVLKAGGFDVHLCGNIGLPMLDALADATDSSVFVVEMSSFQLAEVSSSPDIAVITNLFRDHTDYHGNLEAYWEAKHNIIRFMNEHSSVIYNPQTEAVLHWLADNKARKIAIDINEPVDMSRAKLIGDHNRLNFLMARAVGELFGVDRLTATDVLNEFEPIRHRLQIVRTVRGVTFVDDAIGSTPEATVAGIEALVRNKGPVGCVLLGGVDRKYDFSNLVAMLRTLSVPKLILFPDTGVIIESMLPEDYKPEILHSRDMAEAVKWAAEHTPSGSICLLSTAAPSTVLWQSFEEKGSLFQQAVLDLPT